MKVIFEYKDTNGKILTENNIEKELSSDEILIFLKSKEISYPVNTGFLYTVKRCEIENSVYDMFTDPYKLIVTLKERR
jgi:hypothetical protein